ncbi:replication initiator protein [Peromfec virus RodF8_12]|uniref:Replication initiator protein n=1 Tax=Peromfec virus RodF8_12 TaxID=2929358 RepID=A0A976R7B8_9VIRU|nr:replication initiator protein [Peromfec virus RodF8_12]
MCFQPYKTKDSRGYTVQYDCGRCSACRQSLANSRANKIRHHYVDGYTPWFITLTYRNEFIPYVLKSELKEFARYTQTYRSDHICNTHPFDLVTTDYDNLPSDDYSFRIYRDTHFVRRIGNSFPIKKTVILQEFSDPLKYDFSPSQVDELTTLRRKNYDGSFIYLPDKVSVVYPPDVQNFIKRLRVRIQREYQDNRPISYYYAPEYGPDTHRFHVHFIIWFPSDYSKTKVCGLLRKTWPFCNSSFIKEHTEPARSAADYVASYVNCDSTTPQLLRTYFPLRSSHSLHFGFGKGEYTLSKIVEEFETSGRVTYPAIINRNGFYVEADLLFPKYVNRFFFPLPKGHGRLATYALFKCLTSPEEHIKITSNFPIKYTKDLEPVFPTSLIDRYGLPVCMTVKELNYFINSLFRCHSLFYDLGYNKFDAADFIIRYYTARSSYLYKQSQSHSETENLEYFYNLIDVYERKLSAPTVEDILQFSHTPTSILSYCHVIERNSDLNVKFYQKIKHRKLNST